MGHNTDWQMEHPTACSLHTSFCIPLVCNHCVHTPAYVSVDQEIIVQGCLPARYPCQSCWQHSTALSWIWLGSSHLLVWFWSSHVYMTSCPHNPFGGCWVSEWSVCVRNCLLCHHATPCCLHARAQCTFKPIAPAIPGGVEELD